MGKGFVFLSETIVFSLVVFLILHATVLQLDSISGKTVSEIRQRSLVRKAIFFADALVKNTVGENGGSGIAVYNSLLHRAQSNVADFSKIEKAQAFNDAEIMVQKITIERKNGEKQVFFEEKNSLRNCINVERFVKESAPFGQKALLSVTVCEE